MAQETYINRIIACVTAAQQSNANSLLNSNFTKAGNATFLIGMNATGNIKNSITHYWTYTVLTDTGITLAKNLVASAPGTIFYIMNADTMNLTQTNSGTASGKIGTTWSVALTLSDLGLLFALSGGP